MPPDLPDASEREQVAKWLGRIFIETRGATRSSKQATLAQADAVIALVVEYCKRGMSAYATAPDGETMESMLRRVGLRGAFKAKRGDAEPEAADDEADYEDEPENDDDY